VIGSGTVTEATEKSAAADKTVASEKRFDKPVTDKFAAFDKPPGGEKFSEGGFGAPSPYAAGPGAEYYASLEARVAQLEAALAQVAPFIGTELRPDIQDGALSEETDDHANASMAGGDVNAKRQMDTKPRDR